MPNLYSPIPLLLKWESYCEEQPGITLKGFAEWLLKEEETKGPGHQAKHQQTQTQQALNTTSQISILITRLHRLMVFFTKPVTRQLGFSKEHEFAVLVQIAISDRLNKKEIANKALLEISTTVEITKRLAQKGLIKDQPDKNDRRSALVSLTEKGKKILENSYRKMEVFNADFLSSLTLEEQQTLQNLLSKMNDYHSAKVKK